MLSTTNWLGKGDNSVAYHSQENPDCADIIRMWNEDVIAGDFSEFDIHFLVTDFNTNDQPATFIIEALRSLMDGHKQLCCDRHGRCVKAVLFLMCLNFSIFSFKFMFLNV